MQIPASGSNCAYAPILCFTSIHTGFLHKQSWTLGSADVCSPPPLELGPISLLLRQGTNHFQTNNQSHSSSDKGPINLRQGTNQSQTRDQSISDKGPIVLRPGTNHSPPNWLFDLRPSKTSCSFFLKWFFLSPSGAKRPAPSRNGPLHVAPCNLHMPKTLTS